MTGRATFSLFYFRVWTENSTLVSSCTLRLEAFARNDKIPMEWAEKGLRKEEHVLPALRRMEKRGASEVYFIFKSMEQGRTFRISIPKYPTQDPDHCILAHQRSRFTHYYAGRMSRASGRKSVVWLSQAYGADLTMPTYPFTRSIRASAQPAKRLWTSQLPGPDKSIRAASSTDELRNHRMLATIGWSTSPNDPTNPLASPLYAELRGLPPIRVHVGDDEVLLDDSRSYVERAAAAGVDAKLDLWMGMAHGFVTNVGSFKAAAQALKESGAFLSGVISGNPIEELC